MPPPSPLSPQPRFGIYAGIVSDTADPQQRGRIRVRVPTILPQDVHPCWALPMGQSLNPLDGSLLVPDVGSPVLVQFLEGCVDVPLWMPGAYDTGASPPEAQSPSNATRNKYPKRRVLYRDRRGIKLIENDDGSIELQTAQPITITANANININTTGSGNIVLNGGTLNNARVSDPVVVAKVQATAGPYPVMFSNTPTLAEGADGAPGEPDTTLTLTGFIRAIPATDGATTVQS